MARKKQSRGSSQRERIGSSAPLDLYKVNPRGRVDVLAVQVLDKLAQSRAPQLIPLIAEKKEVIHAAINSQLGPHAIGFDLVELMKQAEPFLPLLGAIALSVINNYNGRGVAS